MSSRLARLLGTTRLEPTDSTVSRLPPGLLPGASLSAKEVLREPRGGPENLGRRRVPEVRDNEDRIRVLKQTLPEAVYNVGHYDSGLPPVPSTSQILGAFSRFSVTFLAERGGGSLGDPPGP